MKKKESGHENKKSRQPNTTESKYNNSKHNMVIFYKKWKIIIVLGV